MNNELRAFELLRRISNIDNVSVEEEKKSYLWKIFLRAASDEEIGIRFCEIVDEFLADFKTKK